jgi:hypothetical protein
MHEFDALEALSRAGASEGQGARTAFRGNSPNVDAGRAADWAARLVGKDRRTLDKAEAVVAAAEADPEKYAKLVEEMDWTGRASGPFERLQAMKQSEALRPATARPSVKAASGSKPRRSAPTAAQRVRTGARLMRSIMIPFQPL